MLIIYDFYHTFSILLSTRN